MKVEYYTQIQETDTHRYVELIRTGALKTVCRLQNKLLKRQKEMTRDCLRLWHRGLSPRDLTQNTRDRDLWRAHDNDMHQNGIDCCPRELLISIRW